MKTIGVIGGMGPQATIDFEKKIHKVSQKLIPQHINQGYPPMVVYYHRNDPRASIDYDVPTETLEVNKELLEVAKKLGSYADFLVIPSNTPHFFQKQIEEASGLPLLSIVEVTMNEVLSQKPTSVGVLAIGDTLRHELYQKPLEENGVRAVTIPDEIIKKLDKSVWRIMEGESPKNVQAPAYEAIEYLQERNVDLIILGCSEITLMIDDTTNLIDPVQLLAEKAVEYTIKSEL